MSFATRQVDADNPEIRKLLVQLHRACFPDDKLPYFENAQWWVMTQGLRYVAFAGMTQAQSQSYSGYMVRAGVMTSCRGQGLQRRLIWTRVRAARRRGWTHLITDTTDNCPSMNNLIACGFRTYAPDAPWAFPRSIYWKKVL